jgi:hypothetical protein
MGNLHRVSAGPDGDGSSFVAVYRRVASPLEIRIEVMPHAQAFDQADFDALFAQLTEGKPDLVVAEKQLAGPMGGGDGRPCGYSRPASWRENDRWRSQWLIAVPAPPWLVRADARFRLVRTPPGALNSAAEALFVTADLLSELAQWSCDTTPQREAP